MLVELVDDAELQNTASAVLEMFESRKNEENDNERKDSTPTEGGSSPETTSSALRQYVAHLQLRTKVLEEDLLSQSEELNRLQNQVSRTEVNKYSEDAITLTLFVCIAAV